MSAGWDVFDGLWSGCDPPEVKPEGLVVSLEQHAVALL